MLKGKPMSSDEVKRQVNTIKELEKILELPKRRMVISLDREDSHIDKMMSMYLGKNMATLYPADIKENNNKIINKTNISKL